MISKNGGHPVLIGKIRRCSDHGDNPSDQETGNNVQKTMPLIGQFPKVDSQLQDATWSESPHT